MLEKEFELYLHHDVKINSKKAVASRMAKARKAEFLLSQSLDAVVASDNAMYMALLKLRENENPAHGLMQNALRKYYIFKNGKEFPRLSHYLG